MITYSRYILCCRGLSHPTLEETKPWFERVFKEYGLPQTIRTDNGAPFASVGLGGLSRLAVWFIKLGIKPERIEPGHPEKNGRHERMHRSLKEATARPPKGHSKEQQKAFLMNLYRNITLSVLTRHWGRKHRLLSIVHQCDFIRRKCRRWNITVLLS